jgi:hypothetical protein
MAVLTNLIRRILQPMSFPRYPIAPVLQEPQDYQPPEQVKTLSVPVTVNPPPV